MDVYLIPVATGRYELYCEPGDEGSEEPPDESSGWRARVLERFRIVVARLDYWERRESTGATRTWVGRLGGDRVARWLARKVAEHRLLWRLRTRPDACAWHPDDLTDVAAAAIVRQLLQRDADRHRRWLIVDAVGLFLTTVVLGPLFLIIPGVANLPAAYCAFRVISHYLSLRGARHGLSGVRWTYVTSEALTTLRCARGAPAAEREQLVKGVASQLRLSHLPRFFKRAAE